MDGAPSNGAEGDGMKPIPWNVIVGFGLGSLIVQGLDLGLDHNNWGVFLVACAATVAYLFEMSGEQATL